MLHTWNIGKRFLCTVGTLLMILVPSLSRGEVVMFHKFQMQLINVLWEKSVSHKVINYRREDYSRESNEILSKDEKKCLHELNIVQEKKSVKKLNIFTRKTLM